MFISNFLPKKLKKRIIVLFFIFTLLFSAVFSVLGFTLLKRGEKQLQTIDMGLAIERIRKQYLNGEDVGRVNRFFYGKESSLKFPEWIRDLSIGFHKIQRDHLTWHVMIVDYPDQRYILLRDYTIFESSRLNPALLSLIVLLSSLLLSLILVWITLFYVIHPIEKLEKKIRKNLSPQSGNQLIDSYDQHEIGQLAQAFDEVYDKLHQALQRERLFTADISHELRTPLMVILSSCELLLAIPSLADKNEKRLRNIEYSAQQILQRLQVYLALARQTSLIKNTYKTLPINKIAKMVVKDNLSLALRYKITLQLDMNNINTVYPADFCYTILSNLIRNAIEYAGPNSTIIISLENSGFTVCDNGIGIDPKYHSSIFEAFTSLNSMPSQHLGLGLSLVQRICEYLQWQIKFSSQHNQGAKFTIVTSHK